MTNPKIGTLHITVAHLLPKLRCHFAEFLNQGSLKRLGILSPPTCVGLRYDHLHISIEAFLGSMGSISLRGKPLLITSRHCTKERICLLFLPTGLNRLFQQTDDLPSCVPPSLKRYDGGTGILTCLPSPTPFGLGLGID
jgi:hypothetical protein